MVWQACEDFSSQERARVISKFRALSLLKLITCSRGLEVEELLEEVGTGLNEQDRERLYQERNKQFTRSCLVTAVRQLENKGFVYFKGTKYYCQVKPQQ